MYRINKSKILSNVEDCKEYSIHFLPDRADKTVAKIPQVFACNSHIYYLLKSMKFNSV